MPRKYITSVKLPTDTAIYYIKDTEAREAIAQMGNFTKYLGMATTMPTNANVTIEYLNPETGATETEQKVAVAGDVISLKTATITPPGYSQKEYIFDGTNWAELNTMQGLLKNFAYVSVGYGDIPNLVKSGTVTVSSTNLAATAVPVTFQTTAITGATKVVTGVTSKSITYAYNVSSASGTLGTVTTKKLKASVPKDTWVTGVSYSKATGGTATVNTSATFTGTTDDSVVTSVTTSTSKYRVSVPKDTWVTGVSYSKATAATVTVNASASFTGTISSAVTGFTLSTSKYRVSVPKDTWVTGVSYSKATSASATGGAATVGSTTVYGLQGSTTKYATGLISSTTGLTTYISVVMSSSTAIDGVLTFYGIDTEKENAKAYTVGKSGATTFTNPTVTITNTKTAGELTKVASTTLALLSDSSVGTDLVYSGGIDKSDITVTVSGSAVTSPTVTITNTKTAGELTKVAATTLALISNSSLGTNLVYSVTDDSAQASVTVSGSAVTTAAVAITNTKTAADLTKVASTTLAFVEDSTGTEVVTNVPTSVTVNVSLSTSDANVLSTITSGYGKVSAYAGGSHTHEVSDTIAITQSGTTAISVYPGEHP